MDDDDELSERENVEGFVLVEPTTQRLSDATVAPQPNTLAGRLSMSADAIVPPRIPHAANRVAAASAVHLRRFAPVHRRSLS